jgi:hypothetical protein
MALGRFRDYVFQLGRAKVMNVQHALLKLGTSSRLEDEAVSFAQEAEGRGTDQRVYSMPNRIANVPIDIPLRDGLGYPEEDEVSPGQIISGGRPLNGDGSFADFYGYPSVDGDSWHVEWLAAPNNNSVTVRFAARFLRADGTITVVTRDEVLFNTSLDQRLSTVLAAPTSGSPTIALLGITMVVATVGAAVTADEVEVYNDCAGLAQYGDSSFPWSVWIGSSCHDFASLRVISDSYRTTALSVRYTDLTPDLTAGGSVSARVIENACGPGDADMGSYDLLSDAPGAYCGLNKTGVYAITPMASVKAREFSSPTAPLFWATPYVLVYGEPSGSGALGRVIVTSVHEIKTASQLFVLTPSVSNSLLLERIMNALQSMELVGDNPSHMKRIRSFLSSVGDGISDGLHAMRSGVTEAAKTAGGLMQAAELAELAGLVFI